MNLILTPTTLQGTVTVPSSKSQSHRELICAALADGESTVENITVSDDIDATCRILRQMGADIREKPVDGTGRMEYHIRGGLRKQDSPIIADCGESGSTLRFLIPVGIISGNTVTYMGQGRLSERPLQPYYDVFAHQDICCEPVNEGLPLKIQGQLRSGRYALPGNVSSQFFTGLLLALPVLDGDSFLYSTTKLESVGYIDITLSCLRRHGIQIVQKDPGVYVIPGRQRFRPGNYVTEGDYSQAAFWLAAGVLGRQISCKGLQAQTHQGDKTIISIIQRMGGNIETGDTVTALSSETKGNVIDVADCPDLVPILAVLAAYSRGTTHIIHAGRVRLKECDRLHAITVELNTLGADIQEEAEGLLIHGTECLHGGSVSSWGDHRIAMALAVAAQKCRDKVILQGAECVRKSYPNFWKDFSELGGVWEEEG